MTKRNEFITKPPTLDRWEVKVVVLDGSKPPVLEVSVQGWCYRRRKALWHHVEVVEPTVEPMKASDIVHHYALVCTQDVPTSQAQFDQGLLGPGWDQPTLWG